MGPWYVSTTYLIARVRCDAPQYIGHWIYSLRRPYGSFSRPGLCVSSHGLTRMIDSLLYQTPISRDSQMTGEPSRH